MAAGLLVGCAALAWWYAGGLRAMWRKAGRGRGVREWQVACYGLGLAALVGALASPLDRAADGLFAAHMVQHLLLLLVAAPLLVLGAPLAPLAWAMPRATRPKLRLLRYLRPLARPPSAFGLHSLALWAWHVPVLYDGAVNNLGVHVAEHLSFVVTGVLFWWALLGGGRAGYGAGVLYVFGLAVQSTLLGALLTFASRPWYTAHLTSTVHWGLSPLDDQQLAGLIMWIPGGSIYLLTALGLFAAWLGEGARSVRRPGPAAHTPARR
ncbi:MAG: cytochrome c oxidase assembly protein [Chloroflexota bacterium]|nr:cytochrome c oxidase assembly protein [Chloroflexota bacterium]